MVHFKLSNGLQNNAVPQIFEGVGFSTSIRESDEGYDNFFSERVAERKTTPKLHKSSMWA